jgi:hypothetical protein|nr:MAG TPA: HOLLIDAY JUNCTION RESOLVASE [Caudoviricetes sp.]
MNSYTHIIGIDPDSKASGCAILDIEKRELTLSTQPFFLLTVLLDDFRTSETVLKRKTLVVMENAYGTTHNWHYSPKDTRGTIAKKGYSIGLCAQTYNLLLSYTRERGLDYIEQSPLVKLWRGTDRKITHEELVSYCKRNRITLHTANMRRSNQEERDAALLAIHHIATRPAVSP